MIWICDENTGGGEKYDKNAESIAYRVERLMENGGCQAGFYNGKDDERRPAFRYVLQCGLGMIY